MRWRIFCPWNLAARKFVMTLNFLWWFLPFIFFWRRILLFWSWIKISLTRISQEEWSSKGSFKIFRLTKGDLFVLLNFKRFPYAMHYVFYLITPAGLFVKHVVHDLELGHHHQGAGEGQGDQQGGGGHDDHMPDGHLSGLNKRGPMSNEHHMHYWYRRLTCGWTMNLYLSTAISTMLELLRNTEMHWTPLVTLQTQSCNRI